VLLLLLLVCIASDPENDICLPDMIKFYAIFIDPAFNSITDTIMPILLRQHRETDIATQKKAVLDVLLEFLEASKSLYGETSASNDGNFSLV
jgi:DNA repair/transcription protein MET18/MMS19